MLVMLPFFCSMLITNDVALLTFVPFTILILDMIGAVSYTHLDVYKRQALYRF